jgi:hypothetical protein
VDELQILESLKLVAVFGLCGEFREAYIKVILQFWYHSIDIHSILLHVEFEDGLSIPVTKTRCNSHKNLQLEIEKFLKKETQTALPLFQTPPLFKNLVAISEDLMPGAYLIE